MKSFFHSRRKPAGTFASVSTLSLLVLAAHATAQTASAPVLVTASRFASDPAFDPIGATVITAAQIRDAGVGNVNDAIRKIGGVYGRQNFNGTSDHSLDLRGFGTTSSQNMVVLVDGIRISENELNNALLSSIPIESVERIEIVRGGSSVLYGEGATGGTIQIITKRNSAKGLRGTAVAEAGSYGHRALRAYAVQGWDGFSIDANASSQRADNYRDNNAVRQDNLSAGMQWATKDTRFGVKLDAARQDSRLAGALSLAQFNANPRQSIFPDDFGSIDTDRYTVFAEHRMGALDVAAELSHRTKTAKGVFVSGFGTFESTADSRVTQFSPRVRHLSSAGGTRNELVVGLDFFRWGRNTRSDFAGFPTSSADATQTSRAIYARDEVRLGDARFAVGARHEVFNQDSVDPIPFTTGTYSKSRSLNAWDAQGNYAFTPTFSVFAKAGQSYRVANVDENSFTPIPNQPLEPQISHDLELGTVLGGAERKLAVRLFQHRLTNEIFFDPTAGAFGANSNLAPTRRKGIEIEASARIAASMTVSATLQHVSAKFTEGPNAGREVVLVPRNTATVRFNWLPASGHSADVGLQWVDSQRYGGDFSNACTTRMPSFTTLDARYAVRVKAWEFAIAGSNLTDRDHFSNAFGACGSGIYPDPGRQLKISARLDF